jgi:2-methylcitrate dehydratase PrpD
VKKIMNETQALIEFVTSTRFKDFPAEVAETATMCVLDTVGVGLYGSRTEWSRMVAEFVKDCGSVAESGVWGRGWGTSAPYAALVNGTSAHGIEMDDTSNIFSIHCGAAVVPAALAVWERNQAHGKDVIAAVVAGYEVAFRLSDALLGSCRLRFYGSPVKSLFGATVAAGMMLDLDNNAMLNAMGIAGSMASGLREWTNDPRGTMVKRFNGGGWPSHNGVTAALLAQKGLTGPATILEGDRGVCRAFGIEKEPRIEKLTGNLGEHYMIMQRCIKPYGACGRLQASVDCVEEMKSAYAIEPDQIKQIDLGCSIKSYDMHDNKHPGSIMAAQYSMPFVTALAFFDNLADVSVWDDPVLSRTEVLDLVQKVEMFIDEELDNIYQETNYHGGTKMTVRLKDGREYKNWVKYAKGTLENPATPEDILQKFNVLAKHVFPQERLDEIAQIIGRLDKEKGPENLSKVLVKS